MTQDELDRLEALANAATPGPWVKNGGVPEQVIYAPTKRHPNRTSFMPIVYVTQTDYASGEYYADMLDGDAEFIAAARDAVPALVAEVRRLRTALEKIAADEIGGAEWYVDTARKALGIE